MKRKRLPGTPDQRLGALIGVWTLAVWLPRIWIIPVGDVWEMARIVVSMALGLGSAWVLLRATRYLTPVLLGFALWSVVVWGRTLWNYWTLNNPTDLRLVHTILAGGFFYLAWRAIRSLTRNRRPATPG